MTIAKGQPWGTPGVLGVDGVVVGSDAEASAVITNALRAKRSVPALGLLGGDLCKTLGGRGGPRRLAMGEAMTFPVDLGVVVADGREHFFVAHLVARSPAWGLAFVAMNAQWRGRWNLGPRAHPNDGRLDTFDVHLGLGDRLRVRARLVHGAHLPHPGIVERRVANVTAEFDRPRRLWLDGVSVGRVKRLRVSVEPDALTVVV